MSDLISSLRDYLRTFSDALQFFVNLVCVVILAVLGSKLFGYGVEAWRASSAPPRTIEGATALANAALAAPQATALNALNWIIAGVTIPISLIIFYSAIEGGWWLVRRLAGRS